MGPWENKPQMSRGRRTPIQTGIHISDKVLGRQEEEVVGDGEEKSIHVQLQAGSSSPAGRLTGEAER